MARVSKAVTLPSACPGECQQPQHACFTSRQLERCQATVTGLVSQTPAAPAPDLGLIPSNQEEAHNHQ